VPAGDPYALEAGAVSPLSESQRYELGRVVEAARSVCGFGFGVFVGPLPEGRESAIRHHAALPDAASAVLVAVDPAARSIEIVTGTNARWSLDNRACEFAALAMKSCFVADDLVGGIREGITLLAAHARHPEVLHLDEPA
jgi:hypothetical protein